MLFRSGLALAGRLHHRQLAELHPLEGREAGPAVRTLPAAPDRRVVLGRPRVLYLRVLVTAKRTAHGPPSSSNAAAAATGLPPDLQTQRSEERRVGNAGVRRCSSRGWPHP